MKLMSVDNMGKYEDFKDWAMKLDAIPTDWKTDCDGNIQLNFSPAIMFKQFENEYISIEQERKVKKAIKRVIYQSYMPLDGHTVTQLAADIFNELKNEKLLRGK